METQIELFKSADDKIELYVNLDKGTIWLNRHQIAFLFDRDIKTIGKHINNVFNEGELNEISTVAKFATVQKERERSIEKEVKFYNLGLQPHQSTPYLLPNCPFSDNFATQLRKKNTHLK
jgi:hypothetical protein